MCQAVFSCGCPGFNPDNSVREFAGEVSRRGHGHTLALQAPENHVQADSMVLRLQTWHGAPVTATRIPAGYGELVREGNCGKKKRKLDRVVRWGW